MPDMKLSSYFYGDEAMQFTYFRIPCQLITHPRFRHLSTDSKLLYGMLLDRMSLSIKNEWYDDTGRVYIYYTVDEICSSLRTSTGDAVLDALERPLHRLQKDGWQEPGGVLRGETGAVELECFLQKLTAALA